MGTNPLRRKCRKGHLAATATFLLALKILIAASVL